MPMIIGVTADSINEKINKGLCPFCQSSEWNISMETTDILSTSQLADMSKTGRKPKKLIMATCNKCGYIAHFDYNIVTK